MDSKPRITIDPAIKNGVPIVTSTAATSPVTVDQILSCLMAGMSHRQILAQFPKLTQPDIDACLDHARLATLTESPPVNTPPNQAVTLDYLGDHRKEQPEDEAPSPPPAPRQLEGEGQCDVDLIELSDNATIGAIKSALESAGIASVTEKRKSYAPGNNPLGLVHLRVSSSTLDRARTIAKQIVEKRLRIGKLLKDGKPTRDSPFHDINSHFPGMM